MTPSDEELVARVIATGDAAAFESLVERHQSKVRNWLRQLTGNPAEADDIAQETFINAWRRMRSFGGRGRFSGWLMKIAYNNYLQAYRRNTRARDLAADLRGCAADADLAADSHGAADLARMLSVLTEPERVAMILSYAHGYSNAEISEIAGLPLGTVKSHIRRARLRLQQRFLPGESA